MSSRGRRRKRGGSDRNGNNANNTNSANNGNSNNGNSRNGNSKNGNSKNGNAKGGNQKGGNSKAGSSKGGNAKGGNSKGGNSKGGSSKGKGGRQKGKQKTPKFDAADFWGDNELLPEPRGYVVDIDDTTAILRSLGRPPIPGSEAAAEHHFALVYERSVNLAKALAAAGGLDQEVDDEADAPAETSD